MKKQYKCTNCSLLFERQSYFVKNENRVFCSKDCLSGYQRIELRGKSNPNYKTGIHCKDSICNCGLKKDYRSNVCVKCIRKPLLSGELNKDRPVYARAKIEIDLDLFKSVLNKCKNYYETGVILGISRNVVKDIVIENKIDISHFTPGRGRLSKAQTVLKKNNKRHSVVKILLLREKLIPYICSECNQGDMWNNKKLVLEMDHINGDPTDNRLENLRFLCPNCHAQTSTSKGKNSKGVKKPRMSKEEIIELIKNYNSNGVLVTYDNINSFHNILLRSAIKQFGSWDGAVAAAGINYEELLSLKKWSTGKIKDELKKIIFNNPNILLRGIEMNFSDLHAAMRRHFGSCANALKELGFVYVKYKGFVYEPNDK